MTAPPDPRTPVPGWAIVRGNIRPASPFKVQWLKVVSRWRIMPKELLQGRSGRLREGGCELDFDEGVELVELLDKEDPA